MKVLIPQIITFLANLIVGILLFTKRRNHAAAYFVLFVVGILVWIFSVTVYPYASNISTLYILAVIAYIGPILVSAGLLLFSFVFPRTADTVSNNTKTIVIFGTIVNVVIVNIPGFVLRSVTQSTYNLETGPGLYVLFSILVFFIVWSLKNLITKYRISKGIYRQQLRYLFTGLSITAFVGVFSNAVLPIFGQYQLVWLGPLSTIVFIFFTSYAIVRHRLLDIRFVITRSLIYFFLILFVAGTFTGLSFLSAVVFRELTGASNLVTTILVSLIIVVTLDPLKRWISRLTDDIFYKAKIDYQDVLQQISEVINREIELEQLIKSVSSTLQTRLKIGFAAIALADEKGDFREFGHHDHALQPIELPASSSVIRYLKRDGKITILESLERKIQDTSDPVKMKELERSRDEMERMHAALAGPILAQGKFNAVLVLGPKLSGDTFSNDELKLFQTLTPQIGSAIEKSRLYEEVKTFSTQLKAKVDEATAELKERNRSLVALQHVTSLATRSLDYKKVLQEIANDIATELGYIGGLIMLKESNSNKTFLGAVTETSLTKRALKLLPKPALELSGTIKDPDLASVAMRTGKIQITDKFEDFVTPPVPSLIAKGIQKLVRAKTIVAEPIYTENEVIGALVYLIDREQADIQQREFEVMRSIADQTGITIRTLRYIDQIRDVNRDLEEANVHLRQLDVAKSEFVSIASHQLRTPMTGIMGYLSMLVEGDFGKLAPEHLKLLAELLSESQRMIRLINLFLNVSKIESGKLVLSKQPIQIADLIHQQIRDQLKPAEAKGLVLKFEPPKPALPVIQADGDKLMNVIQNLVDNAIKYTERGSVTIRAFQQDGKIQVEIKDTGVGIKREDVGELFHKFVRGSGIAQINPDGSGLGLFIAKSVVEMHGGQIWVTSEGEGKGSTFAFTIPIK